MVCGRVPDCRVLAAAVAAAAAADVEGTGFDQGIAIGHGRSRPRWRGFEIGYTGLHSVEAKGGGALVWPEPAD